jgi:hypothetical protein
MVNDRWRSGNAAENSGSTYASRCDNLGCKNVAVDLTRAKKEPADANSAFSKVGNQISTRAMSGCFQVSYLPTSHIIHENVCCISITAVADACRTRYKAKDRRILQVDIANRDE